MACLQICRELLLLAIFLRVHSNSKEVTYFPWQNTYPNLKTTCQIKLKFFLWTELLENLLHAFNYSSILSGTKWLNSMLRLMSCNLMSISATSRWNLGTSIFNCNTLNKLLAKAFVDVWFINNLIEKYRIFLSFLFFRTFFGRP